MSSITIRHREDVLQRELSLGDRDEELIARRLRTSMRARASRSPITVLKEGVKALKEQRFQYKAPPGGLLTAMFGSGCGARAITKWLAAILIVLGLGWYADRAGWFSPDQAAIERNRIALQEELPKSLADMVAGVKSVSRDPEANRLIDAFAGRRPGGNHGG